MNSVIEPGIPPTGKHPESNRPDLPAGAAIDCKLLLVSLACFIVGLAVCLLHNLSKASLASVWLFDSGHYLVTCEQVAHFWRQLVHGLSAVELKAACFELKQSLLMDGPILPSAGALVLLITNKSSAVTDPKNLIILQGLLHATSAVLLCVCSRRLTGNYLVALVTGLLWALYPPAVIGAGKFLTETIASVLILGIMVALSQSVSIAKAYTPKLAPAATLTAGILTGCLMLTKPALPCFILAIYALSLRSLMSIRARIISIAIMLIGLVLPVLPWAAFTEITTGHASITIERMSTFNVVNGLDLESNGGTSLCKAPFALMFPPNSDALPSALGLFLSNPERTLNLILRKVPRLVAMPWNDAKLKFCSAGLAVQQFWHQLLLLLGVCGALAFLASARFRDKDEDVPGERTVSMFIGEASIVMILGHFVNLLVMTEPRYEFTAVPFLILFAGFILGRLYRTPLLALSLVLSTCSMLLLMQTDYVPYLATLSDSIGGIRIGAAVIKIVLLSLGLSVVHFIVRKSAPQQQIRATGNWSFLLVGIFAAAVILAFDTYDSSILEWSCRLPFGATIKRTVRLQLPAAETPVSAMVIFDAGAGAANSSVTVNGQPAVGKPASLFAHEGERDILQLYSTVLRTPADQLRQWQAAPVALSSLNLAGLNHLSITYSGGSSVKIYGSYPPAGGTRMKIPSLGALRFLSTGELIEGRLPDPKTVESAGSQSYYEDSSGTRTDDLSPAPGRQFGQYHMFLIVRYLHKTAIY